MMKCKDRIIPDADDMGVIGIIKLIEMDLEEICRNTLVEGGISIFLSRNIIRRLASEYYKWMRYGYLNFEAEEVMGSQDAIAIRSIDVNGQIFGCKIRSLAPWAVDIKDAYRIVYEERTFLPLKWFHNYIDTDDSDELHWSVCSKGMEPKYIERFNTKEFVDGIIANYNDALINGIHGTLLDDIKKEEKLMMNASKICRQITNRIYGVTSMSPEEINYILEDNEIMKNTVYDRLYNRFFNRFFDSGDALIRHIKSVTINKKKGVTTVTWDDGDVTMVRPMEGIEWDDQQAIDECIMKKLFKTNSHHKKAIGKVIAKARIIEDKSEE